MKKSSAIVSQGLMRLEGRTTGAGFNSAGIISGQIGSISATISSGVIEQNKFKPDQSEWTQSHSIAAWIFVGVLIFGAGLGTFNITLIAFALVATPVAIVWTCLRKKTPEEIAKADRIFEKHNAAAAEYSKQWYCFQCGRNFESTGTPVGPA